MIQSARHPRTPTTRQGRSHLARHAPLLLLPLAAACGDPGASAPADLSGEVFDSAGVTVVQHASVPADLPVWTLADTPEVSVGVVDGAGPEAFSSVSSLVLRSDGSIVVLDGPTRELRAFGPAGRHLWTAGGQGEGPGEFLSIGRLILLPGDSILVPDGPRRQGVVFSPDGSYARAFPVAPPRDGLGTPVLVGATSEGAILFTSTDPEARWTSSSGSERSARIVGWLEPDGDLRAESALRYLGNETIRDSETTATGSGSSGGYMMLQRVLMFQMSPQASFTAGAHGATVGIQERFEFHRYTTDGTLARVVRVMGWPVPLDRARLRAFDNERIAAIEDPAQRAAVREVAGALLYSETLPAFDRIIADADDRLWVQEFVPTFEADERERGWWVLDAEGAWVARATFPQRFILHAARGDLAVGVRRDEFDVHWVEVRRIVAGGAGR